MDKKHSKLLMIIVAVLSLVGIILYYMSYGATEGDNSSVGVYVNYAYFLLIGVAIYTVVASLISLLKKPAALKKALIGLGIMAVVLVISYVLADDNAVLDASGNVFKGSEGATSKWVGTAVWYSLILLMVGGALFVVDMFKNIVK